MVKICPEFCCSTIGTFKLFFWPRTSAITRRAIKFPFCHESCHSTTQVSRPWGCQGCHGTLRFSDLPTALLTKDVVANLCCLSLWDICVDDLLKLDEIM